MSCKAYTMRCDAQRGNMRHDSGMYASSSQKRCGISQRSLGKVGQSTIHRREFIGQLGISPWVIGMVVSELLVPSSEAVEASTSSQVLFDKKRRMDEVWMMAEATEASPSTNDNGSSSSSSSSSDVSNGSSSSTSSIASSQATDGGEVSTQKWKSFIDRDYLFRYPSGEYVVIEESAEGKLAPGTMRSENPIRVELKEVNGKAKVTVVQEQAARLKQTLFQITDIAQFGSAQETARLVFPPGTKVMSAKSLEFPQPAKDTGTVLGKIERDPLHVYRYQVRLPNNDLGEVAVGIILGRVLLLGASASEENWEDQSSTLKKIADSFKLLPRS